ncbi:MAG: porin [Rhodospirillales bacterium]
MYKLLATSALVAAGLWGMTEAASAQAKVAPVSVSVGGYHSQQFGFASNKKGVNGNANPNNFTQFSDSEIWFRGSTTLANGITAGFRVELEGNTSGDQIDESFMFLEGAFGRVELGTINTVAYRMDHSITFMPNRGYSAQEGGVYGAFVINPTAVTFLDTTQGGKRAINGTAAPGGTATGTGEDQQKINYYTPRVGGIQVGATFLPNYQTEDASGFADRSNARTNAYSFAINHVNNFSGVQLNGSASYTVYPKVKGAASSAAAGNDIKDMSIGGQLGAAGFLVGLGYRNVDAKNAAENGSVYGVGVNYTTGPMILHASYIKSKVDGGNLGANGDDTYEHWILSANYDIGPGVALIGSVFWAEFKDDATTTANNNNKGAGALAGISLMF